MTVNDESQHTTLHSGKYALKMTKKASKIN